MAGILRRLPRKVARTPIQHWLLLGTLSSFTSCDAAPDIAARRVDVAETGGNSLGGGANGPPQLGPGGMTAAPAPLPLTGDLQVHDPEVVVTDSGYQLFFTGNLITTKASADLLQWRGTGEAFSEMPLWLGELFPEVNDLWAPDVSFFGGAYHLYYAASTFGTGISCIGHATTSALDDVAEWRDEGFVICSDVEEIVDWDAIDPATFADESGDYWMVFGSYSSGIKLIALSEGGGRHDDQIYSLAARPEEAIQAPAIFYHDDYYYLFASFDQCCAGIRSTSTIRVGRSEAVTGPFVDRAGTLLLEGGGSPFVSGDEMFPAVGGSSFFALGGAWYAAYHAYDASSAGQATLRISPVVFDDQKWPMAHAP